jgi:hypothetical protein
MILQVLHPSVNIERMKIPPRAIEPKPTSKFHCDYHRQMRVQAGKRRIEAFRLYVEGKPVTEIAATLAVNCATIWRYVAHEMQDLRLANTEMVEALKLQQLHKLDRIANEAWRAWEDSRRVGVESVRITDRQRQEGTMHEEIREIEQSPGDVRYLQIVLTVLDAQRALLGIGPQGSDATIGISGPVRIATVWGGTLQENPAASSEPHVGAASENNQPASETAAIAIKPPGPERPLID